MSGRARLVWESDRVTRPSAQQRDRATSTGGRRTAAAPSGTVKDRRRWRGFVSRYGWRAYALPILVLITALALFTSGSPGVRHAIGVGSDPGGDPGGAP